MDTLLAQSPAAIRQDGDTLILDLASAPVQYSTQAFDPATGGVTLYPIAALTCHAAPATMYQVQTTCGRRVTLTGDHNLWVLRDGQLQLIQTAEARPTDYMPLPEHLPAGDGTTTLDTLTVLAGKRLFVEAPELVLAYVTTQGAEPFMEALVESGLDPNAKLSAIRHDARGRGIAVDTFRRVLEHTHDLSGTWDATQATVGGKRPANRLPSALPLTPAFLRLLGYYIAEGNHQTGYVILANRAPSIRRDIEAALTELGLPFSIRPSSDYQVSSTALAELLGTLCGTHAQNKRLPSFWPQLSDEALGHLLRAYFDGDGTVGKASAVIAATASPALASDLAYALLRFGIWARSTRRWKRATNSQHAGDWYIYVTISGQANLKRFHDHVGFSLPYKEQALEKQREHAEHSNVDVAPIRGEHLRALRTRLGLTAGALGVAAGISRAAVQLFEAGRRAPRRITLIKLLAALQNEALSQGLADAEWESIWASLSRLCQVRWTRIAAVDPIEYQHPYVYDFSVPGPETFLAGVGGLFVHNTYVMAEIVERVQRPTLVMAHNKTLAAQLYAEFKEFFPKNAVEYFVSYYDYYQPEAYVPRHDLYIEKDAEINDEIERLRLAATSSLLSRPDVLIVASVSAIYGLGSPEDYGATVVNLRRGETRNRDKLLRHLVSIHYDRNDYELRRGRFRVRGDTVEVQPAYGDTAYRVEFFGDEIERITEVDPLTGEILLQHTAVDIYPAKHFITPAEKLQIAVTDIENELTERVAELQRADKLLEAQRIQQRTRYDLEMLREVGYCSGIENYSRHLARRQAGDSPWTLLDYFPDDFLMFIDESHMSLPQIRGMYHGDRSRKETLVDYGFRLPSALDNRPLTFEEFEQHVHQIIYVSATPGPYEMQHSRPPEGQVVEQIIRPTGLIDPQVTIKPTKGQIDDLLGEIRRRVEKSERVLVTTLTKRMAEDLADYLAESGIKVHYLHSEIQTLERIEILRDLRQGTYDVVVGINLLREGLDLPEVSLV
ncbi:MAG: excinuclease ABC subunit UvrB, partial [Anaerolineae bacterium]|nr:excinuclease ABC subunit UvrB [Anaerolineae bacterium]